MSEVIPGWMLSEIQDWMKQARTGELALEFNSGRPQRFRRHETCSPPKDGSSAPGVPHFPTQICPVDGAAMAEDFTHEKMRCSKCGTVYTVWDLRRRGTFVTQER